MKEYPLLGPLGTTKTPIKVATKKQPKTIASGIPEP